MTVQTGNDQVPETDHKPWWKWDAGTWTLLGGLLLLSMALFHPRIMDAIFIGIARAADFRLWPWWYFPISFMIAAFSFKWFLIAKSWYGGDIDETDLESTKKFLLMSITITTESVLVVLFHMTAFLNTLSRPLWMWFKYGTYSHTAAFAFLLIVVAVVITCHVLKEWLTVVLRPE